MLGDMFGYSKITIKYLYALFSQCYFMLTYWLPEGWEVYKDLEPKLYSQFEKSFISCLKQIFVFTNGIFSNTLKNLKNKLKGATKWSDDWW